MTVLAALLDENGVYLSMEALEDASQLTERHLPQITFCDLPPGKYRWIADEKNPEGGAFWPVKWLERVARDKQAVIEARERAVEFERIRALAPQLRRAARAAARRK